MSCLDALLTPPRPGSHESSRHFYESARAIVAGYMAWVRFREPKQKRTLATLYRMLSMLPKQREAFAKHVRSKNPFAGGLTHIAVQRQAQVGKEEGGSNFTTIANQLAFLNYPELLAHTQDLQFRSLDPGRRQDRPLRGRPGGHHRARQGLVALVGRHPQRRRWYQNRLNAIC